MLPTPLVALVIASQLSPITATFGGATTTLRGFPLQVTSDGRYATDGDTWVDLVAEKVVPASAVPSRDKLPRPAEPTAKVVNDDKPGERLQVVHPKTRAVHHLKPPEAKYFIMAFAVNVDGKSSAILTDNNLHLFDTATEECVRSVSAPRNYLFENPQVALTPDGTRALLVNSDRRIQVVPVDRRAKPWSIDIGDGSGIWAFAVSADGGTLAVKDSGGVVRGYDVGTGTRVGKGVTPDTWLGVAWLDDHTAACWSRRGRLAVWDTCTGKVEREFTAALPADTTDGVDEFITSPDGKRAAVLERKHANGSALRVLDLATGKATWELPDKRFAWEAAFHPDGTKLGVNEGREFHTYDLTGKAEPGTFGANAGLPCRFNDDGRTVFQLVKATVGHAVVCAETAGGKERWTWRKVNSELMEWRGGIIGLHPAGDVVWVANGDCVHGIDRLNGSTRWAVERLPVADKRWGRQDRCALFAASRDDRWLAACLMTRERAENDGEAFAVFDLHTKAGRERPLISPTLQHRIAGLAVSPDGRRVIVLTPTGEQQVWDLDKLRGLTPDPFDEVWEQLGLDGVRVVEAMTTLTADPARAVELLAENLPPVKEPDAEQVKRWLGELGSPDFKTRDRAERQLNEVLDTARALILSAAEKPVNAEAGERLERLVKRIDGSNRESEALRVTRSVEVIERLRTPAAVKLLERWAGGAPDALLTTEAKASLKRIKK